MPAKLQEFPEIEQIETIFLLICSFGANEGGAELRPSFPHLTVRDEALRAGGNSQ
ncbi:hypothetical protein [Paenibacillus ferrarius]|uniref:hypothetical protein n=1 Tax=Paenibacillus ferrarius TaxID=1469647 RepID=UPI003D2BAE0E